jgi:hypothetical protein
MHLQEGLIKKEEKKTQKWMLTSLNMNI